MTRQEEIRNAIDKMIPISTYRNGRTYEQSLMATGFESGVEWADANPKSPWISVDDDLPCNHEDMYQMSGTLLYTDDVLVLAGNMVLYSRRLVTCMMFDDSTGKWKWNTPFHVKHWMRIPKLEEE